jgi:FSR family fosmidomycin resistance protein-like MFS transporter
LAEAEQSVSPSHPRSDERNILAPVGVMALAHLVNDSYANVLPALVPLLIVRLDIGLGLAGILITLYQAASSFTQPLFGQLGDRGGSTRWMAWLGVAMSGIGASALAVAPGVAGVAVALLVGGLGTALYHPASAALVAGSVPQQSRGRWMSVYITSGNVGLPIGPLVIGIVLATMGFDGIWIVGIPGALFAFLVWRLGPRQARRATGSTPFATVWRANRRLITTLVSVAGLRSWANGLMISFIPVFAVGLGMSTHDSPQLLTLFLVFGIVGSFGGGWLGDHFGRDRMIVLSLLAAVPFCILLAMQQTVGPAFLVATAGTGALLNASFVLLTVRGQESLPGSLGLVSGLMLGFSLGLGGLGVAPMAIVAEVAGIQPVFVAAGAIAVAGALLMRALPPPPARSR